MTVRECNAAPWFTARIWSGGALGERVRANRARMTGGEFEIRVLEDRYQTGPVPAKVSGWWHPADEETVDLTSKP